MARTNQIPKTKPVHHDFTQDQFGHHLTILDYQNNGESLYVAGCAKNVLLGDHIMIKRQNYICNYFITQINYCSSSPNEWRAILQLTILQLTSLEEIHS